MELIQIITVIIIVYNSEKTIKKCIESIINQNYYDIEIIVINDGSTDKTEEIIKSYSNIKLYNIAHKGVSYARNLGIKFCKTPYFMFVDSDDFLEDNAIKIMYDKMKEYSCDIVIGSIDNSLKQEIILTDDKYDYLFNQKIKYIVTPWNKLYKKSLFKDLKYPDLSLAEDEYLFHHILKNSNKIVIIPNKTYNYTVNNGLSSKLTLYYMDAIKAFENKKNFFKNTKYGTIALKQYLNYLIYLYCLLKDNKIKGKQIISYFKKEKYSFNLKYYVFKLFPNSYYKLFKIRRKLCKKYQ